MEGEVKGGEEKGMSLLGEMGRYGGSVAMAASVHSIRPAAGARGDRPQTDIEPNGS
jgi:hypothetical protein